MNLGLILLLVHYTQEQRSLLEEMKEVRDEVIEEVEKKGLSSTEGSLSKATDRRRKSIIRLIISIIWLGFMVWMITTAAPLLLWIIWLVVGFFNTLFGIVYHVKRMRKSQV